MNKQKKTICKSVKYNAEELKKLKALAEKSGKRPSAYIRDKALNIKILTCNYIDVVWEYCTGINECINKINDIARTVNTNKSVYSKDIDDLIIILDRIERLMNKHLKPFAFEEKRKPIWLL